MLRQHVPCGVPLGMQPGLSRAPACTRASQLNIFADSKLRCLLSCSLDYQDVVTDGFYDLHGDFSPELERDVFPSLAALRALKLHSGDKREVSRARSMTSDTLPGASVWNLLASAGLAKQSLPLPWLLCGGWTVCCKLRSPVVLTA